MLKNEGGGFRKKFLFLSSLFIALLFIFFLTESNLLVVKNIKLSGTDLNCTTSKELEDYLNLKGQNILKIKEEDLEKQIKNKFLCIKKIILYKTLPDKIDLEILTRTPFGKLKLVKEANLSAYLNLQEATPSSEATGLSNNFFDGETVIIDSDGFAFSKDTNVNIPQLKIVNQEVALNQKVNRINIDAIYFLKRLQDLNIEFKDARILENDILVVTYPIFIFDLNKNQGQQLASLQLILREAKMNSKPINRIDLRFDKPVIVYGER